MRKNLFPMFAGFLALLVMALPDSAFTAFSNPETLAGPTGTMMLVVFPVAVLIAARLLYSGIAFRAVAFEQGTARLSHQNASLILCGLVALKLLDSFHHFMVWDTTYDPLGIFWLFFPTMAVLLAGMLLLGFLPGNKKWAGLLFFFLIPTFLGIAKNVESMDFRQLTESRAEKVSAAIEAYHAREGVYPESLGQLIPGDAIWLSKPVILFGQDWCYEGGDDHYRLGTLNRDHWSSPILYGKVYASNGRSPSATDVCQSAIDRYHAQNPRWNQSLLEYGRPTPTPDLGK